MFGKLIILQLKVIEKPNWEYLILYNNIGGDFSILKLFLKLSCYHDNYFQYFMFRKRNGFVSKARVSACMYFLVSLIE